MRKSLIGLIMIFALPLFAQQNTISIDISKLDSKTAASVLKAQKASRGEITPSQVDEWAKIGLAIGNVIKTTAKTVNVEVTITAPAYFTKGKYILTFDLLGTTVGVDGSRQTYTEKKRVSLYISISEGWCRLNNKKGMRNGQITIFPALLCK